MRRSLPILAVLASLCLHIGVVSALILYPVTRVEIEIPPVVQLVKLAPPPPPEPVVEPEPVKPPPPPPPTKPVAKPEPKPVPKSKPKPEPAPKPVAKPEPPQPEPRPEPPVETAKAAEPEPVEPTPALPAPAKPVYKSVNVQAAYLNNPRPDYPRIALRRGWEGVVVLQIDLDKNGEPQRVEIADSSGHHVLDKAAQAAVRRWRFNPATRDGEAIAARGVRVPIQFQLDDA